MVTTVFPVFQIVRGKQGYNSVKDGGWKVVTIVFSVFQTIREKLGYNSIKNTVAKRGDNRVFGVSDRPRETGL